MQFVERSVAAVYLSTVKLILRNYLEIRFGGVKKEWMAPKLSQGGNVSVSLDHRRFRSVPSHTGSPPADTKAPYRCSLARMLISVVHYHASQR